MAVGGRLAVSVLLDTHVFFWWVTDSTRLSAAHRALFETQDEPVYVSAVSGWKIAIKVKLGKWSGAERLVPGLEGLVRRSGLQPLDLTLAQAEVAGSLDLVHRDPFDRLLAAQALDLGIPIATIDSAMALLGCRVV
jgi:PIN domain nuclease of toxin-antitoxin system